MNEAVRAPPVVPTVNYDGEVDYNSCGHNGVTRFIATVVENRPALEPVLPNLLDCTLRDLNWISIALASPMLEIVADATERAVPWLWHEMLPVARDRRR